MSSRGQDTSEVRHLIDVPKLESFFSDKKIDIFPPISLRQFKAGQSNPTYLITDGKKKKYVLRKKPPGKLISKKAHAVEREYNVLNKLKRYSQVAVPEVYLLCEDVSILGTPFYIMEFISGRIFTDVRFPELNNQEKIEIWMASIDSLSKLHRVDFEKAQLQDHGKKGDFYTRQLENLLKLSELQAKTPKVDRIYRVDEIYRLFISRPVKDEVAIIHGDYKIDNMVFSNDSNEVIGILDWELSTIGHPLFDLSNLLQPFYTKGLPISNHPAFSAFYPLTEDKSLPENFIEILLRRYCSLTNRPYPIPNWDVCMAFSFFRLAVISQGVAARAARGQASSQHANTFPSSRSFSNLIFDLLTPNSKI